MVAFHQAVMSAAETVGTNGTGPGPGGWAGGWAGGGVSVGSRPVNPGGAPYCWTSSSHKLMADWLTVWLWPVIQAINSFQAESWPGRSPEATVVIQLATVGVPGVDGPVGTSGTQFPFASYCPTWPLMMHT